MSVNTFIHTNLRVVRMVLLLHHFLVHSKFHLFIIMITGNLKGTLWWDITNDLEEFLSPHGTRDRPLDLDELASMREAFIEYEDGIKEHMVNNRHTSEDPCRRMDKYLKGKNWFQLSSKPTGARLEGKQSTLPVVELKQKDTSSLDKPSLSQHPQSRLCNHSNLQLKVFRGTSDTCQWSLVVTRMMKN